MSSFKEKMAASKAMPRPTLDVSVSLNRDLSEKREALMAELAEAKANADDRMSAPTAASAVQVRLDELLAEEDDTLITLRFTRLPGDAWNALTRLCPPNTASILDMHYRYGLDAVCKLAAAFVDSDGVAFGHVVEGDELTALKVVKAKKLKLTDADVFTVNEWADLFAAISGPEFSLIVDTLYALNVYGPSERLAELKKRSASLTA
jgi:hypothetical protein